MSYLPHHLSTQSPDLHFSSPLPNRSTPTPIVLLQYTPFDLVKKLNERVTLSLQTPLTRLPQSPQPPLPPHLSQTLVCPLTWPIPKHPLL